MEHKQAEALALLGLTQEQLQERVIEQISKSVLFTEMHDEDGDPYIGGTAILKSLEKHVQDAIDRKVTELAQQHVDPEIGKRVEEHVLQKTNQWGEKVGDAVTFTEYLVQRADAYMREEVDIDGRAKGDPRFSSYGRTVQTRIAYMIDQHLSFRVKNAMEDALKEANSSIVKGLEQTVKMKLAEISKALKVELKGIR